MVKSVTIKDLPTTKTIEDSDLLIISDKTDGVTRSITKLDLFSELTEDVGDIITNGVRSVVPVLNQSYDLGSSVKRWRTVHTRRVRTAQATFGNDSDISIYHSGSHSYIDEKGTGNLRIRSNGAGIALQGIQDSNLGQFIVGGGVILFHNGSEKIRTTADGVKVTGNLLVGSSSITQQIAELQQGIFNIQTTSIDSATLETYVDTAVASATSSLTSRIDADSDGLVALSLRVDSLSSQVLFDSAVLVTSNAWSTLTSRIDLDSDRLSSVSSDVTSLTNTVDNLNLKDFDSSLVGNLITSSVSNATSSIISRIDADSDGLAALSLRVDSLSNEVYYDSDTFVSSTAYTGLTSRINLNADSITSLASDVTSLTNTVNNLSLLGFDSDAFVTSTAYSGLTSRINLNADSITSLASDVTSLTNTVNNLSLTGFDSDTFVASTAYTGLTSRINADSDGLVALSLRVDSLSNQFFDSDTFASSITSSRLTSRIDADSDRLSVVSGQVTTFQSSLSDLEDSVTNTAQITQTFDTRVTAVEGEVTNIKAEYVLETDVNGHVAGIKLLNTGATSDFSITANKFNIINASNNEIQPFTVSGNEIRMTNATATKIDVVNAQSTGRTTITSDGIKIETSADGGNTYVTRVKIGNLSNL